MLINAKATFAKNDMPSPVTSVNCIDLDQRQADIPVMSKEFHSFSPVCSCCKCICKYQFMPQNIPAQLY